MRSMVFFVAVCLVLSETGRLFAEPVPVFRKVVISDLHLGSGLREHGAPNPLEDFLFDSEFGIFLEQFEDHVSTELIIAGDFVDFLQVKPELNLVGKTVRGSSPNDSQIKLKAVYRGHLGVFRALRRFLKSNHENRIVIIPGNHDADFTFPSVQQLFRTLLGTASARVDFRPEAYQDRKVYIAHGHQFDPLNRFRDPVNPVINGRLEVNWGTKFVVAFWNREEERDPFIDNVHPETDMLWHTLRHAPLLTTRLPGIVEFFAAVKRSDLSLITFGRAVALGPTDTADVRSFEDLLDTMQSTDYHDQQIFKALRSTYRNDRVFHAQVETELASLPQPLRNALGKPLALGVQPQLGVMMPDPYLEGAKDILRSPAIQIVVFGHTHDAIGGRDLGGGKMYFNDGCWHQTLDIHKAVQYRWEELDLRNHDIFPMIFSYVLIDYSVDMMPHPRLLFWTPPGLSSSRRK